MQRQKSRRPTSGTKESAGYNELDDAICAHLASGNRCHPTMDDGLVGLAADSARHIPSDTVWRLIDRRLQALRKAGRIRHVREVGLKPRWELVSG